MLRHFFLLYRQKDIPLYHFLKLLQVCFSHVVNSQWISFCIWYKAGLNLTIFHIKTRCLGLFSILSLLIWSVPCSTYEVSIYFWSFSEFWRLFHWSFIYLCAVLYMHAHTHTVYILYINIQCIHYWDNTSLSLYSYVYSIYKQYILR